jgi:hypothetical protein
VMLEFAGVLHIYDKRVGCSTFRWRILMERSLSAKSKVKELDLCGCF